MASRITTQPPRARQVVSSTSVPGRERRPAGTITPVGPNRKLPAARSRTEANTLRPSGRGEHSHSTLPLGATRALVSQSDRNAYSAMGGNGLGPSTPSGSNGSCRPTATTSPSPEAALAARVLAIVAMVSPGSGPGNHFRQDVLDGQG